MQVRECEHAPEHAAAPDVIGAARSYWFRYGWAPVPVSPRTKRPMIKNWQNEPCETLEAIERVFGARPGCWLGIVTGRKSGGLLVVDVDIKNGNRGDLVLAEWERRHGLLAPTRKHRTPSGGWHLFYRYDPSLAIGSCILAPGVEISADSRQVLVPPTPGYEVIGDA